MCSPGTSARDVVLAELAALDPGSFDALDLMTAMRELSAFIDQAQGELARLTGALDARGGAGAAGYRSTAAFLRHGCGRTPGRAGELVAMARGLRSLGATAKALATGDISFDTAHVICRATAQIGDDAAAAAAETMLLDAARGAGPAAQDEPIRGGDGPPDTGGAGAACGVDPAGLRRLGEELAYMADPDTVEDRQRRRWERRHLSFGLTLDDVGTVYGACGDPLSLEIIKTAADAFSAPDGATDTRTAAQRRMDGLVAACKTALDTGKAGTRHTAAPHISVLVEEQTLARRDGAPPGRTGYGTVLTARQLLALACSAQLTTIRWKDGRPLDVGRSYRTETPAIRLALAARDQGCRWTHCGMPSAWCTAHHLRPWSEGGRTSVDEMALFCFVHHHYAIHQDGWIVTGDPNGTLTFTHPRSGLTLRSPLPGKRSRGP